MGTGWRRAFCTSTLPRNSDVDATTDEHTTASPHPISKSPRPSSESNSPLKLSLFRTRSNCGVCAQSVKTGQGTAIYTSECGHAFHFPCIATHVKKQGKLACPVCAVCWKHVPLLAVQTSQQDKSVVAEMKISALKSVKNSKDASPKQQQYHHCKLKPVAVIRGYDDDESLLTPTPGGKFLPIPEADDDEVEEFQGFFVNPVPSCSVKPTNSSRYVDVKPMPEAAMLSVSQSYETYALALKVKAPSNPTRSGRAPIDLVAVVQLSRNMNGSKLHMLKRAMRLVISSLDASDRLSIIIAFSAATKRLLPLRRMSRRGQLSAKHIIDQLTCGGGANVGEALKKAIKVLEDRRERNSESCIMLLSDEHRRNNHLYSVNPFPQIQIPVHDFSYGEIHGDSAFTKGLSSLLNVVVQDLRIKLKLDINGADITAVYCNNFRPTLLGSDSIQLEDLYAAEEREVLLEVRVPSSVSAIRRPLLTARCSYKNRLDRELIDCKEETSFHLPKLQPIRSTAPKIERLRNLFIATRAIAEARGLIEDCRDYSNAHRLLLSARRLVLQSSTSEMTSGEYVRGLEMEMVELGKRREMEKQMVVRKQAELGWGLIDENGDPLTPTSAWRAAEMLAKVAMMKKKSLNRGSDLHGFENARF